MVGAEPLCTPSGSSQITLNKVFTSLSIHRLDFVGRTRCRISICFCSRCIISHPEDCAPIADSPNHLIAFEESVLFKAHFRLISVTSGYITPVCRRLYCHRGLAV